MEKVEQRGESRWAHSEFGRARLGDERRRVRAVKIATRAAESPSGRVSDVFHNSAERQGAYDFLESPHVRAEALVEAMCEACVERCETLPFVFVPLDGTSLSLVDRAKKKNFGAIGSYARGARGLKVIDAIAVSPQGSPLGVCALQWWARPNRKPKHRHHWSAARKVAEKETQHWLDAIEGVSKTFAPSGTRVWFQLDREGDAWPTLRKLTESGQWFTVRSRSNRRLRTARGVKRYLQDARRNAERRGSRLLHVPAGNKRKERDAKLDVRAAHVPLDLLNAWTKSHYRLPLNVVFVRETHTVPRGEKPVVWTLLTNHPIDTQSDVDLVIEGYAHRWRIEEFHRAWKSGVCDVEAMQLHSRAAATKWATFLAAVAVRAERLKRLAREQPNRPASDEFSPMELKALRLAKERQKKRTEVLSDRPTLAEAVRWVADLGGYTGKSSGGPPGVITIGRGLHYLRIATEILEALRSRSQKR